MSKSQKFFSQMLAGLAAGMFVYNKYTELSARDHSLDNSQGHYYESRHGRIYYSVSGSGSPLLLIHDLSPSASSEEWNQLIPLLSEKHQVYSIDLLGCGRSDKPKITYTCYLYIQILHSFIQDVIQDGIQDGIQEKPALIASNLSVPPVMMLSKMYPEDISSIYLINPPALASTMDGPDRHSRYLKLLSNTPLIGTFFYNIVNSHSSIDSGYRHVYLQDPSKLTLNIEQSAFDSAHSHKGNGKYLHSSIANGYLMADIRNALSNCLIPITILVSESYQKASCCEEYQQLNSFVEIVTVPGKMYPHIDHPQAIADICQQ